VKQITDLSRVELNPSSSEFQVLQKHALENISVTIIKLSILNCLKNIPPIVFKIEIGWFTLNEQ